MGLGKAEPDPVEFRPASGSGLDGKPRRLERLKQRPSGTVDGGSIPERGLGPGEKSGEKLRFFLQEFLDRAVSLLFVAGTTGQGQVGDPVRPSPASGMDVVDLQRNVFRSAVDAGPAPLLQEILPNFVAGKRALLVFDPGDLRGLHPLQVEPDKLLGEAGDGSELPESLHPREGRLDPVPERRSQPALGFRSVQKPGFPVAEGGTSPSSERSPGREPVPDLAAPVGEFRQEQDVGGELPVRLPGSSLIRTGCVSPPTRSLRRMVKGALR